MSEKKKAANGSGAPLGGAGGFFAGPWRVWPERNRIEKEGLEVSLEPRVMEVVVHLAGRAGAVVGRAELLDAVWGDRVVNEEALTRAIWEIRNAFGDDPKKPVFVETIRKGGYRWIAPVTLPGGAESPAPSPAPRRSPNRVRIGSTVLIGVATLAAALIGRLGEKAETPAPAATLAGVPFTSYSGVEAGPAFSPDGGRVAFSWDGGAGGGADIYVKQRNTETPLRLTDDPADESFPVWSPDGSEIAFFRAGEEMGVYAVPSIGGPARKLVSTRVNVQGLDWSPDGKRIAYSGWVDGGRPPQIDILSLESGETWPLTRPEPRSSCDFWPRYSPDGRTIAFIRSGPIYHQSIHLVPSGGGGDEKLVNGRGRVLGLDWAADGKSLVYSSASSADANLWRVLLDDRTVHWLPTQGKLAAHPSVSPATGCLIYEERTYVSDIWRVRLEGEQAIVEESPLIVSTRTDYAPGWSPDGKRIAFLSTRTGSRQVWVANADGTRPRALTSMPEMFMLPPVWSSDGEWIAFSATPEECSVIYVVPADGGEPVRLGDSDVCHEIANLWSRRGDWLYFERGAEGDWALMRARRDGGGESLVAPRAGEVHYESAEGDLVYHRIDEGGLWRIRAGGGEEECLVPAEAMAQWNDWSVGEGGVYFNRFTAGGDALGYFDFGTGDARIVGRLAGPGAAGLAVSPDGSALLYSLPGPETGDLILVEDFR